MIYLIGSMRNPRIPELAEVLRENGHEVFDDWHCVGPRADDHWTEYEKYRGRSYKDAMDGPHVWNVFNFDKNHLDASDTAVLVMPAGKSAHLELGYVIGSGKRGFVYFDGEPERWDIMYRFATGLCFSEAELLEKLNG